MYIIINIVLYLYQYTNYLKQEYKNSLHLYQHGYLVEQEDTAASKDQLLMRMMVADESDPLGGLGDILYVVEFHFVVISADGERILPAGTEVKVNTPAASRCSLSSISGS